MEPILTNSEIHNVPDRGFSQSASAHNVNYCVIIPTYNNDKTLEHLVRGVLEFTQNVIVINDGSTDRTPGILSSIDGIFVINHPVNLGKGKALKHGFEKALDSGFDYAISIDSDGQHFPEDIPLFIEAIIKNPDHLIVGARQLEKAGQPSGSSFANKFSNFWFTVETGLKLPDTQSGFRMYPLSKIKGIRIKTIHYDFELEILVKASWKSIGIISLPVRVYYPPQNERVSHFRPVKDFARISLLNVRLVLLGLFWYRPWLAIRSFSLKNLRHRLRSAFNMPNESIRHKSNSVALGIFFGIVPIWGYQLLSALLVAHLLKLNKMIVVITAQISIPPMIPLILYLSILSGEIATGKQAHFSFSGISFEVVKQQLFIYVVGACILAVIAAVVSWFVSYGLLKYFRTARNIV